MTIDKVRADHFYKDRGDKIKINWSLYEFSNILFTKIAENPKLAGYRKKHNEENIVGFCVYYSKRMRQSIFKLLTGEAKDIVIEARYIYEFYPDNTYTQTQRLLEAVLDAWREHALSCSHCPNRCMQDGFEITPMFDNLEKTGWPTV